MSDPYLQGHDIDAKTKPESGEGNSRRSRGRRSARRRRAKQTGQKETVTTSDQPLASPSKVSTPSTDARATTLTSTTQAAGARKEADVSNAVRSLAVGDTCPPILVPPKQRKATLSQKSVASGLSSTQSSCRGSQSSGRCFTVASQPESRTTFSQAPDESISPGNGYQDEIRKRLERPRHGPSVCIRGTIIEAESFSSRKDGRPYNKVRPWVIVQARKGQLGYRAAPVHSYNEGGCRAPTASSGKQPAKQDPRYHSILYEGALPPEPFDGEEGLLSPPIRMIKATGRYKDSLLGQATRINFACAQWFDYNDKINVLGHVEADSFSHLIKHYKKIEDDFRALDNANYDNEVGQLRKRQDVSKAQRESEVARPRTEQGTSKAQRNAKAGTQILVEVMSVIKEGSKVLAHSKDSRATL